MKNRKSTEKLIQAVQLRADATLRHCAILNNDTRILALTSRDIVATEAHYHASCYKSYTNIKTKERDAQSTEKLEAFMSRKGEAFKPAPKKNIRKRLESELDSSIHIFPNESGKLLLVPDSLYIV